mmetsp:Transcript_53/g.133  ORF Transcript_53/g.133 Transcript_53/m.133 type:complete len:589 (+) Transcript_53:244-2010(+)|eukprot:CAMPEP_0195526400 /NCGR_PEP_ID=MMETSP0794_2-20130614/27449_1 /TAXON_ID=515487 /ORGANISM="Stephanopyxis turris, Strain CCMP 815" /LENGTH=588 /DNA_ID=CAMNT_0040657075 /DNA_START=241 /DNA_END=2010 /DNA_ORIENTATION=-
MTTMCQVLIVLLVAAFVKHDVHGRKQSSPLPLIGFVPQHAKAWLKNTPLFRSSSSSFFTKSSSVNTTRSSTETSSCTNNTSTLRTEAAAHEQASALKLQQELNQQQEAESVHLKLNPIREEQDQQEETESSFSDTDAAVGLGQAATLHTYSDSEYNIILVGLNTPLRKFHAWANYTIQTSILPDRQQQHPEYKYKTQSVTTKTVQLDDGKIREELRRLWRSRCLISERTEPLAVYASDGAGAASSKHNKDGGDGVEKRGGFADLLTLYADRLAGIVADESEIVDDASNEENNSSNGFLIDWLKKEYGEQKMEGLMADKLLELPVEEQLLKFQHFLGWFRSTFPYYYDRCDHCGASTRDKPPIPSPQRKREESNNLQPEQPPPEEVEEDNSTFLGYTYPSPQELKGKATRTELYLCHKCGSFTRFPRYNSAPFILKHKRGRCGEYSMLLFRFLRAAGYEARWVVDWSDHVWSEVYLREKGWVHLDPCEAAVDEPLLYQKWGKEQTYIIAFCATDPIPRNASHKHHDQPNKNQLSVLPSRYDFIEDVTTMYTSDSIETIQKRREESSQIIQDTLRKVSKRLGERFIQQQQ